MFGKKFFERPREPMGFQIRPVDLTIFELLDKYRVLDSQLIYGLLRLYHPELAIDSIKHRLQKLWANGFLDRPREQVVLAVRFNQFHLVYTLAKRGALVLAEGKGKEKSRLLSRVRKAKGWGKELDPSYIFLEHGLEVSRFRAALELSGQKLVLWHGDGEFTKLITFWPSTDRQQALFAKELNREGKVRFKARPDAFFGLGGERPLWYGLEIDKGTESGKRVARKLCVYLKWLKFIGREPMQVGEHLIRGFRVLLLCRDEPRIKSLMEWTKAIDEHKDGRGHRGFWFALADQISWKEPESILKPIWRTTHGDTFSLLDL